MVFIGKPMGRSIMISNVRKTRVLYRMGVSQTGVLYRKGMRKTRVYEKDFCV